MIFQHSYILCDWRALTLVNECLIPSSILKASNRGLLYSFPKTTPKIKGNVLWEMHDKRQASSTSVS